MTATYSPSLLLAIRTARTLQVLFAIVYLTISGLTRAPMCGIGIVGAYYKDDPTLNGVRFPSLSIPPLYHATETIVVCFTGSPWVPDDFG